jgi:hypothetical protein
MRLFTSLLAVFNSILRGCKLGVIKRVLIKVK